MPVSITGSILYDLVACPHRLSMDLFEDPRKRDPVSPFVRLLWERGQAYEAEVIAHKAHLFLDLSDYTTAERERRTAEAMANRELLIYGGRIAIDDLVGEPDLLRWEVTGYVPGDIKSGAGEEGGEDDRKPKVHYAVQLALYVDALERLGLSAGRRGFIWDVHGEEVPYDLTAAKGAKNPDTLWDDYQECLAEARSIVDRSVQTLPASSAVCKLCHWNTECSHRLKTADDLSLLPFLGRTKRDVMLPHTATIKDFADADPASFISGKKTIFSGIGPDTLIKFHDRARLVSTGGRPYLRSPVTLPHNNVEVFFDIEVDPMRDHCYLHGFLERHGGDNATERFTAFFADEPSLDAEREAFRQAWQFIEARRPCMIYYYSKYERTVWRKLQQKYADVCTSDQIEAMFHPSAAVDLYYDVVLPHTEWPTRDYSIKTLAKYLGFEWRDTDPSGAASIEWFNRHVTQRDPAIKTRILQYNEDDCRATRWLLDGLRAL